MYFLISPLSRSIIFNFRESIEINKKTAALIWHPIITFENIKASKSVKLFGEMDGFLFHYINDQSGHPKLVYAEQFELTLSCQFHLTSFPFDSHKCRIEFGDLYYETRFLNLNATTIWLRDYPFITPEDGPAIINNLPYPYKFQIESLPAFEINFNGSTVYSFTGALLTLERKSIGSLMSGYPTSAFALLSMISYLIDADIVRFSINETKTSFRIHYSFNLNLTMILTFIA